MQNVRVAIFAPRRFPPCLRDVAVGLLTHVTRGAVDNVLRAGFAEGLKAMRTHYNKYVKVLAGCPCPLDSAEWGALVKLYDEDVAKFDPVRAAAAAAAAIPPPRSRRALARRARAQNLRVRVAPRLLFFSFHQLEGCYQSGGRENQEIL